MMKALLITAALALALAAIAQDEVPAFCHAQDPADPDWDITDYDPERDADDWCKLAYHQPHKAKRQLSKAVALVRTYNNPNRLYFDTKRGAAHGSYIQLLRPWMAAQNAEGTADWRVVQSRSYDPVRRRMASYADIFDAKGGRWRGTRAYRALQVSVSELRGFMEDPERWEYGHKWYVVAGVGCAEGDNSRQIAMAASQVKHRVESALDAAASCF